ncbi:MAG: Glycosyltransferase [Candidatus Gottesmanbacteria bacterium GW2011_GWC2_39_8]|uniref:Glycosyltransferase n=1 Tax=Candidatus Gottesmanbacteria bacterium GW2011_GWC2_39_8 TaxID=1618450 RepID=A0A0G0QAD6_9BACT|nr:MAG: Glycosyltransferase [Candidatus Gottesmanbacteria bacterium GW2011_GWC2_39_8]
MKKDILASVIIPTYKRPDYLKGAILSLYKQNTSDFEIVAVDNDADPKIEKLVKSLAKKSNIPTIYVPEPNLGFHLALHAGAKKAKGQLLIFTNDDVTFDKNYVRAYINAFNKYPEMAAAGAPIKLKFEENPPGWLKDLMGKDKIFTPYSYMEPYDKFHLSPKGFFFETSMGIRKEILFKLGGFNPELFGDLRVGDGETGLNRKLWQNRLLIGYIYDAIIYHHTFKSRMTIDYLMARFKGEGSCDIYALLQKYYEKDAFNLVSFSFSLLLLNFKAWIGHLFLFGKIKALPLKIKLQTARTLAQFEYLHRFRTDSKLRNMVLKKNWLS